MKIIFIGTKGYIEENSKHHLMHTSTLIKYKKDSILIDCGIDWLNKIELIKKYKPKAILITHAHPDHAWGLQNGSPCPIYASKITWEIIKDFNIKKDQKKELAPYKKIKIKDFEIEMFPVEHSIRCPGNGYKIKAGKITIFYSGDIVYINEREKALKDINCYIGDASTLTRSMIRRKDNKIFGHSNIKTQIGWCKKEYVKRAIFTHCGKEIVEMGYQKANNLIKKIGQENNVNSLLAYDNMTITLR